VKHFAKEAGKSLRFALESTARTFRLCLVLVAVMLVGSLWWLVWVTNR
jgi:hypothetical protein